jgi:hypothetical protein
VIGKWLGDIIFWDGRLYNLTPINSGEKTSRYLKNIDEMIKKKIAFIKLKGNGSQRRKCGNCFFPGDIYNSEQFGFLFRWLQDCSKPQVFGRHKFNS